MKETMKRISNKADGIMKKAYDICSALDMVAEMPLKPGVKSILSGLSSELYSIRFDAEEIKKASDTIIAELEESLKEPEEVANDENV